MATTINPPSMYDVFERNKYDLKTSLKKSTAWYSQQVLLLGKQQITPQKLMRENTEDLKARIIPGNLYMFAYDPKYYPLETYQQRLWHPIYFQSSGECIQLALYLSEQQMMDYDIATSDFSLEGILLHTQPTSRRLE